MLEKLKKNNILVWVTFFFFIYASALLYIELASQWTNLSRGINTFNRRLFLMELPTVIIVASFFYFTQIRSLLFRFFLPLLSVVVLFRMSEIFYATFKRSPTLSDFDNLLTVSSFSVSAQLVLLLLLLILFLPYFVWIVNMYYRNKMVKSEKVKCIGKRLGTLTIFFLLFYSGLFYQIQSIQYEFIPWSDENNIRQNGRLSTFFYLSYQEIKNRNRLANSLSITETKTSLFKGKIKRKPNIHFIVMESFIDPREIKELGLGDEIISHKLRLLLSRFYQPASLDYNDNQAMSNVTHFSHVLSPIYGGGTAQAEFELLSGIPALAKVNKIEFNVLRGGRIDGLTARLDENGYQLHATIAPSARFFNSQRAYQSFSFINPEFLQDEEKYAEYFRDTPIFDGELLEKNLSDFKHWRSQSERPIFNYVLGMYGHYPFARNNKKRPDKIFLTGQPEKYQHIVNQFYYRTDAVAKYLQQLFIYDPEAVILVISDHLPAILDKDHSYKRDWHANIALYFEAGQLKDLSGLNYFEIPHRVWQYLIDQQIPRISDRQQLMGNYFQALMEGSRKAPAKFK